MLVSFPDPPPKSCSVEGGSGDETRSMHVNVLKLKQPTSAVWPRETKVQCGLDIKLDK